MLNEPHSGASVENRLPHAKHFTRFIVVTVVVVEVFVEGDGVVVEVVVVNIWCFFA